MTKLEEKQERSHNWHGKNQPWIPGIVLIFVGGVLMLRNFMDFDLRNWWALFILIPAISSLFGAYEAYRESGTFNRAARSSLVWGIFFTMLSATFLFSLGFGAMWPAFLILAGLAMLAGAF